MDLPLTGIWEWPCRKRSGTRSLDGPAQLACLSPNRRTSSDCCAQACRRTRCSTLVTGIPASTGSDVSHITEFIGDVVRGLSQCTEAPLIATR